MIEANIASQILSMDNYYSRGDQSRQEFVENTNFYDPETLLQAEIIQNIASFNHGKPSHKPCNPYEGEYLEKTIIANPTNVVIVEGIFAAYVARQISFPIEKLLINLTTDSYRGIITKRKQRNEKDRHENEDATTYREKRLAGPSFFRYTAIGGAKGICM